MKGELAERKDYSTKNHRMQTTLQNTYFEARFGRNDFSPIDPMGITWVDTAYSKAYLRHLFTADEFLGKQIASIHNLGFYLWLVREAREHILAGDFAVWKDVMVKKMSNRL
jgi:queuine tRNA-ribosyltransferase